MSHEIRTPLNAILGFSSLLRNKNLSESSQDDYLRNIKQSGERLLRLISDIIDTSKIESNQISIIKENCNLNILIDDVIQQCSLSQRNSKAEIKSIKGLADEESHIITDCHRLTQILINLLTNALKFTKEGAITIAYEQKEDTLQFYVRDTGIGIPADQQENIFKRFSQTDQSGRNVKEGSGLGLSIVKGLLKLMEGEIWVESELGKGSCFYFSIPHNPTDTPTKNIASKTPLNKKFKALQDAVVLVVEDNEVNRFLLEAYLKDHIGKIIEAYNGQEAIELVKSHNDIDVVLMDINMPIMDGYEAVKLIKEYNSDITVIAQTGHAMEAEIQELKKSEFDDYLIKPVDEFKLLEMLKKSIDSN
jgi:CheY-like chemotaxis protein/anti-sigma regulatory factor (Ser/Thr protein kinase)